MHGSGGRRVALIVEDDALIRSELVSEFNWQGWQVLDTERGEEAIALATEHHIDLLVTDINLGGALTGWDIAEAVRVRRPDLTVVYASGNPPDSTRSVKGSEFVGKPFDPADLAQKCTMLICD